VGFDEGLLMILGPSDTTGKQKVSSEKIHNI
jgi:hypothetical protein